MKEHSKVLFAESNVHLEEKMKLLRQLRDGVNEKLNSALDTDQVSRRVLLTSAYDDLLEVKRLATEISNRASEFSSQFRGIAISEITSATDTAVFAAFEAKFCRIQMAAFETALNAAEAINRAVT
jgi:hypothetical protein